jgi:hypothetical protein
MNILNRLEKLEHSVIDDSTVCECFPQRNTETFMQDLSAKAALDSQPVLSGKPVPHACPNCRKPIEKHKIIIQLCDGTTPERFPDEWKSSSK